MQISKNFLTICAIALLASIPNLRAAETDAQAKAREELRKRMAELDAQEKGLPAPTPTTPPQAPPAVAAPVPSSPAAAPAPRVVDDEATARAREAMRQKLRQLDAPQKAVSVPPPQAIAPAPVAPTQTAPPTPVKVSADQPTYAPVLQTADDEATARARAATRQKIAELEAQQSAGKPAPADAGPAKGQVASESKPEFKSVAAPPLPISGSKEARLAELLRRYKADEITPDEYHRQRAKTLAEP
jgi:hypothetical protein